ncbi:Phthiocerol synthesis polyketide synthase type I PpsC [Methyloligella halotolerans]|uniref:Phthiocerol synthesis polyketide synthase type I PpsC n=1 Tax=Methyloligella halotolerans TaxID=1177755 RepID=A0A1E2S0R4_9HYPH|nr:NADPH:quinone oxidoreductase family protein [Methyloligella halotolerans]ODA68077.1 Phthiocerol synthesis polyketide synthase type I PpsC [Methyloligella halotolerans]
MRAAQFKEFGGIGALHVEEVDEPVAQEGEVVIRVNAVGLNFFDTLILKDKYQITPPLPYSPGAEIAGTIDSVGAGVSEFEIGQRVVAFIGGNGCREKVATKARNVVPIPTGVSDEFAAGLLVTYGTALHGFKNRARLQPGETVAILGAAGGAGVAAIHVAKLMGARVIAVASSGDKLAYCREHGADMGLNYKEKGLKPGLRELTDRRGVDVLYDCVGGDSAEPALRAMAWEGRYLVIGFAAGEIPKLPLNLVLLKGCSIIGVFWTAFIERSPDAHRENMLQTLQWADEGKIAPHIQATFPLVETGKALTMIEQRKVQGKLIVRPQD